MSATRGGLGLKIALTALAIGVAGDTLLRSVPWGLNIPIMMMLCVTAVVVLKHVACRMLPSLTAAFLYASLIFFASWFAVRDSEPLLVLNALATVLIGTMLFLPSIRIPIWGAGTVHYLFSAIATAFSSAFLPFILLSKDVRLSWLAGGSGSGKVVPVLRGVLIAAPLVMVFGALFVSADASFERLVQDTFRVVPEELFLHAFFTAFFAWPAAGYLRAMTLGLSGSEPDEKPGTAKERRDFSGGGVASVTEPEGSEEADPPVFGSRHIPSVTLGGTENQPAGAPEDCPNIVEDTEKGPNWDWRDLKNNMVPEFLTVGPVEIGWVLGSLNALFLTFVIFQLPYLFGGMELVQNQPGLKLAEYARRGFGELFAASFLVLPILMALHWLIRKESGKATALFRYLAAIQIGLLFVIMLSAMQRLLLLTGELGYGMTTGRFYPMSFLTWLAVVFVIFGLTVLRGRRHRFASTVAASALVMIAALNFLNPDDFIVRTNLQLREQGRPFDAEYNSSLSADAVPALMEAYPELDRMEKDSVMSGLVARACRITGEADLRNWNLSRAAAARYTVITKRIEKRGCGRKVSMVPW